MGSMEPRVVQRRRLYCALGTCLLVPDFESVRPGRAMGVGYKLMSTWMEVAVDEGMSGEEFLRLFGRFKSLHLPLAPSRRPMRILGPIVQISALSVLNAWKQLTPSDTIAPQLASHDHSLNTRYSQTA